MDIPLKGKERFKIGGFAILKLAHLQSRDPGN
jgi:hypothetical protein